MTNGATLLEKFENGRTTIENDLLLDNNLTATEKVCYMYLEMLSYKDGYCYATNKQLGDMTGQTSKSVEIAILRLKQKKYIIVDTLQTRTPYKRRIYTEARYLRAWNRQELPKDCTVKQPPRKQEELDRQELMNSYAKFRKFLKMYLSGLEFKVSSPGSLKNKIVKIKENGYYTNISDDKDLTKEQSSEFERLLYDRRKEILDNFFKGEEA